MIKKSLWKYYVKIVVSKFHITYKTAQVLDIIRSIEWRVEFFVFKIHIQFSFNSLLHMVLPENFFSAVDILCPLLDIMYLYTMTYKPWCENENNVFRKAAKAKHSALNLEK